MRTSSKFLDAYRKLAPNPEFFRGGRNSDVALVDLALHFLSQFLPTESVGVIPFLLSGYPRLAGSDSKCLRAGQSLRHFCASFSSAYAWRAAMETHAEAPDVNRAYRVENGSMRPLRREAASDALLDLLEETLRQPVPHVTRKLTLAKPGPARVYVDHHKTRLDYVIPAYTEEKVGCKQHDLVRRAHNPPIAIRWSALIDVAREIDRAEAAKTWTTVTGLPRLNLEDRLEKIRLCSIDEGLFRDDILTIEGVRHLVGMLSSGKSTLVLALLFTLARPEYGKRILVLSPDTTAAAVLSARLKAHGIISTVLSSFKNRDEHLSSIHWHQAMTAGSGWSMTGIGRLVSDFGVACPLDGHQIELSAVTGVDHGELRFPLMSEKACHQIEQQTAPPDQDQRGDDERPGKHKPTRSCPLFSFCPAQSQQRNAVYAQVIVMTAPAFLMMHPDKNVLSESMSFPELVQFNRDLVIVDEVDAVQRTLDDHFAVPAPIMGGEGSYLPQSALAVNTALQQQGGAQYASRLNVAWQIRLSRLEIAVSGLYSLLLNRWDDMSGLNLESEFTAATILCRLWKSRADKIRGEADFRLTGETEVAFQKILAMAGTLATLDEPDPLSRDDDERSPDGVIANSPDAETEALLQLRAKLRNGVPWRALLDETRAALSEPLREFNTFEYEPGSDGKRLKATERNALAILAALYANIVLSSFNFLVRNQSAVSAAFQLDEYTLLDETRNLLQQYRSLIPESPGGNAFGLVYEHKRQGDSASGDLKLVSNLGVGRYLLTHLHVLLQHENQAGPHVLLLSGTSWAGGKMVMSAPADAAPGVPELPKSLRTVSVASPSYDVQVPVAGYLDQPAREREELANSLFELVPVPGDDGKALSVSGLAPESRRLNLQRVANHLAVETGGHTRVEWQWLRNEKSWGVERMKDRRRSLFVVQSYNDGVVVANAIRRQIDIGMAPHHQVYVLVNDKDIRANATKDAVFRLTPGVVPLPRSLVEDFGSSPEGSILVVPLVLIARGHNILNANNLAAISSIYFLHRPHPRPEDRSGIVGQVNRFALDCLNGQVPELETGTVLERGRLQRYLARMIARRALSARGGYSMMPEEEQARFAWDLITPLWQTIGRGIRGGVPVYVGFVDAKFSPGCFEGSIDTPAKSCLQQALKQLRNAMDRHKNPEAEIAAKLYGPFYESLNRMFLQIGPNAPVNKDTGSLLHLAPDSEETIWQA